MQLLRTMGVKSKVELYKQGGTKDFGPTRGGVCEIQPLYRLTIPQSAAVKLSETLDKNIATFSRLRSFADVECKYTTRDNSNVVVSVSYC